MTTPPKRSIAPADILPDAEYAAIRVTHRKALAIAKKDRRIEVGPVTSFYFENWDTVWYQIQEMLHIEKGGATQLDDEIAAYASLIPQQGELVATVMIEVDDAARRAAILHKIGGIENHTFMKIGDTVVRADPDPDRENTSPDGKASSVQFFHFRLPPGAVAAFKTGKSQVLLGFDHPNYGHIAVMPENVRAALSVDLD